MVNILTKEFDCEIANWYYKKILYQTVITNKSITVIYSYNKNRFIKSKVSNCLHGPSMKKVCNIQLRLYIQGPNSSFFIFLVVNNYISFKTIKNLIKNLLSLNCQSLPQNKKTFLTDLKNLGSYTQVLTVLAKRVSQLEMVKCFECIIIEGFPRKWVLVTVY